MCFIWLATQHMLQKTIITRDVIRTVKFTKSYKDKKNCVKTASEFIPAVEKSLAWCWSCWIRSIDLPTLASTENFFHHFNRLEFIGATFLWIIDEVHSQCHFYPYHLLQEYIKSCFLVLGKMAAGNGCHFQHLQRSWHLQVLLTFWSSVRCFSILKLACNAIARMSTA